MFALDLPIAIHSLRTVHLIARLLLPEEEGGEEPSGAEMAAALRFQLQRLHNHGFEIKFF